MKSALTLVAFLILIFQNSLFAQPISSKEVPYNVISTFAARFGRATDIKWEKKPTKPADWYKVSFRKSERSLMAEFSEDGRWQSTMETISVGQLPREIVASIAKNMKGHRMKSGLKMDTYSRGLIYTVSTESQGQTYDFTFNPEGRLLYFKETTPAKPKP